MPDIQYPGCNHPVTKRLIEHLIEMGMPRDLINRAAMEITYAGPATDVATITVTFNAHSMPPLHPTCVDARSHPEAAPYWVCTKDCPGQPGEAHLPTRPPAPVVEPDYESMYVCDSRAGGAGMMCALPIFWTPGAVGGAGTPAAIGRWRHLHPDVDADHAPTMRTRYGPVAPVPPPVFDPTTRCLTQSRTPGAPPPANKRRAPMDCEVCQRTIADVFATDAGVRRHATCPAGTCANCKTEMPYADLERVELADGEIDPDPDLLVCSDVFQCQVRTGERDPDDVPTPLRRAPTGYECPATDDLLDRLHGAEYEANAAATEIISMPESHAPTTCTYVVPQAVDVDDTDVMFCGEMIRWSEVNGWHHVSDRWMGSSAHPATPGPVAAPRSATS